MYSATVFTKEDMEKLSEHVGVIMGTAVYTIEYVDHVHELMSFLSIKVAQSKLNARPPLDEDDD
jgi:hypothetical protein